MKKNWFYLAFLGFGFTTFLITEEKWWFIGLIIALFFFRIIEYFDNKNLQLNDKEEEL